MNDRIAPRWRQLGSAPAMWFVSAILTSGVLALLIVISPVAALVVSIISGLALLAFLAAIRGRNVFLASITLLLIGYAFMGRGFAHLGIAPLYVGEVVLGIGLISLLGHSGFREIFKSPLCWLIVLFAGWGAIRTFPFVRSEGVVALRDGVVWGYSVFALLVGGYLLDVRIFRRAIEIYDRLVPVLLVWIPIWLIFFYLVGETIPRWPGTGVPVLGLSNGNAAVHLAGIAAFLLVGLRHARDKSHPGRRSHPEWIWWAIWALGALIVSSQNRGGFLAICTSLLLVFLLIPSIKWWRAALTAVVVVGTLAAFDVKIDVGRGRYVSAEQIATNVSSIFGGSSRELAGATKQWRLDWWSDIVDYTVFGPYFWAGKGYGVNLAIDDGYLVGDRYGPTLRSPHNGHMTILARSGVIGLGLWVVLQAAFAVSLLVAFARARRRRDQWWMGVNIWMLAFWVAFLINAVFAVNIESPQGGIWLWSIIGLGIAATEIQRRIPLETGSMAKDYRW